MVCILSLIFLTKQIYQNIIQNCTACLPYEACGFLIGCKGSLKTVFTSESVHNQSSELNRYIINPIDFYTVESSLKGKNLSIIGFYHSHPSGTPHPSRYDIQDAWPDYSYLILANLGSNSGTMKCWLIDSQTGTCQEESICMV